MAVFQYKAAGKGGRTSKGLLEADTKAAAVNELKAQGLYPLDIKKITGKKATTLAESDSSTGKKSSLSALAGFQLNFTRKVSTKAVAAAIRQLATLLGAGLPLDKALSAMLEDDDKSEVTRIFSQVRERVREGGSLAGAFGEHPQAFSSTFVSMVHAGENSGALEVVMERMAEHFEQQLALKRKIQSTMAYPLFMLIIGGLILVFLVAFVVPKVVQIFSDLKQGLPLPTRILIGSSEFMRDYWWVLVLVLVAVGIGGYRFAGTKKGRVVLDRIKLRIPILGSLLKTLMVGRFTRTLGMLLKNGVTLVKSLEITKAVSDSPSMKALIERLSQDVQEGKSLTKPMPESGIFLSRWVRLIAAGEKSGQLDKMLMVVAGDCENEVENRLQMLTSLMEPIMIVFLGLVVGFVVVSIILPIFEMSSLVG